MIVFKEKELIVGDRVNAQRMPFSFEGKNNYKVPVTLISKASCWCTTVSNVKVNAGETFKLDAGLTKRSTIGKYRKKITVTVLGKNNNKLQEEILYFTINVIKI